VCGANSVNSALALNWIVLCVAMLHACTQPATLTRDQKIIRSSNEQRECRIHSTFIMLFKLIGHGTKTDRDRITHLVNVATVHSRSDIDPKHRLHLNSPMKIDINVHHPVKDFKLTAVRLRFVANLVKLYALGVFYCLRISDCVSW
jgi:hypothetical protein